MALGSAVVGFWLKSLTECSFGKTWNQEVTLANLRSSKKDIRRSERRRIRNSEDRNEIRTYARKILKALQSGNQAEAKEIYPKYASKLDKAVKTQILHKNNASRHKSRMALRINKTVSK